MKTLVVSQLVQLHWAQGRTPGLIGPGELRGVYSPEPGGRQLQRDNFSAAARPLAIPSSAWLGILDWRSGCLGSWISSEGFKGPGNRWRIR